jgi:cytochrome c biogenesis protein CcmG, thiol:disulfide interchange protein DsbE
VRLARLTTGALIAVVGVCGCTRRSDGDSAFRPLDVGAPVPTYAVRVLTGDTVHVGGLEAPTVLNVWATWCTSCAEEMGTLDSLARQFRGRGVRVVAVSVDDGDDTRVRRFVQGRYPDLTIAHDPAHAIERLYELVGVPTTFVIGRDGHLIWRYTGNINDDLTGARAAIDSTLAAAQKSQRAPNVNVRGKASSSEAALVVATSE